MVRNMYIFKILKILIVLFSMYSMLYIIDSMAKPQRLSALKPMKSIYINCKSGICKTPNCPPGSPDEIYKCLLNKDDND